MSFFYFRKPSPVLESLELHVDQLSRNVNEAHLREIFSMFCTSILINILCMKYDLVCCDKVF